MLALSLPTLLRVLPVRVESPLRLGLGAAAAGFLIGGAVAGGRRSRRCASYVKARGVYDPPVGAFTAMLLSCFLWALDGFRNMAGGGGTAGSAERLAGGAAVDGGAARGLFPTIGGLGAVEADSPRPLCLFGARLEQALAVTVWSAASHTCWRPGAGGALLAALGGDRCGGRRGEKSGSPERRGPRRDYDRAAGGTR